MTASERVAAHLRQRILSGELAAGRPVPSTRALVAEFGIAMATASKVLAALRAEGLVVVRPGVGTVVAPSPAAPAVPEETPTSARAVAAAVVVADAEGLAAVSMRRLGAELGVSPMSVYRHVADKQDLVARMADAVLRTVQWPRPPRTWRARLEVAGRLLWQQYRRHPWLAQALGTTRPQLVPAAMAYSEWVLAALHEAGLDPQEAFTTHLAMFGVVRGSAIDLETDAEEQARTGQGTEEWVASQEPALRALVFDGRHPRLAHVVGGGYDFSLDAIAALALARFLDGVEASVAARPSRSARLPSA